MKKIYLLLSLLPILSGLIFVTSSFGQSGTWTWISGDNIPSSAGVYGTQGVPSVSNHPPANYEMIEWKDKQGNFWLYGGTTASYSDVWRFNPFTLEWTWMKGDGGTNEPAVYGTQGVADAANTPGFRSFAAATWVDTSGAFWLFGGSGATNDLWRYDIGTNEWTWVNGNHSLDGMHGTLGVPSSSTVPGARQEDCSAWTDSLNNLWLFGGSGYDDNGANDALNDLCKYDISTNEWTWIKGSAFVSAPANYGTKGLADSSNDPGARWSYTKWKDKQNDFWIFGGGTFGSSLNDMWKYNSNINQWTWMGGSTVINNTGNYGTQCVFDSINNPASRIEQRGSVTDSCGRFWLFGGVNNNNETFNDLWLYDPNQLQWELLSGNGTTNPIGNYGTIGVPSAANIPPSRRGADAWWGNDNRFYISQGLDVLSGNSFNDVWVFNPDTNCVPSASCAAVAVIPPVADFQVSQAAICANACINFTDLSTNATAWQWSFAGALDSTSSVENPQNVCYSKAGIYNVTLIASNAAGRDTVTFSNYITVTPTPPVPVITQHQDHDTLYCSFDTSYYAYQWFLDSALISGATDTFLVISKSGNYNVEVTNKNGCSIAGGINVVLGVENYSNDDVVYIYPNPVENIFRITDFKFRISHIEIYDILGKMLMQSAIENPQSAISIDVSWLASGIYFVRITNESGQWVGKFVKE